MQKLQPLFWLLFGLFVLALSPDNQAQTIDSAKINRVRPYVEASNAKWCEAHRIGDPELLASLFTPDGALLGRDGKLWQGHAAIDSLFTRLFTNFGTADMTITTLDLWVVDSLAYEYGRYTQKLHTAPDSDTTTGTGMYFEIWKQMPDGSWKIWRDAGIHPDRGK